MMEMVLVYEKKAMRVICAHALQMGKSNFKKEQFYSKVAYEYELQNPSAIILGQGEFDGRAGQQNDGFESVHGGYRIGK